jgi:hypothetical protein
LGGGDYPQPFRSEWWLAPIGARFAEIVASLVLLFADRICVSEERVPAVGGIDGVLLRLVVGPAIPIAVFGGRRPPSPVSAAERASQRALLSGSDLQLLAGWMVSDAFGRGTDAFGRDTDAFRPRHRRRRPLPDAGRRFGAVSTNAIARVRRRPRRHRVPRRFGHSTHTRLPRTSACAACYGACVPNGEPPRCGRRR